MKSCNLSITHYQIHSSYHDRPQFAPNFTSAYGTRRFRPDFLPIDLAIIRDFVIIVFKYLLRADLFFVLRFSHQAAAPRRGPTLRTISLRSRIGLYARGTAFDLNYFKKTRTSATDVKLIFPHSNRYNIRNCMIDEKRGIRSLKRGIVRAMVFFSYVFCQLYKNQAYEYAFIKQYGFYFGRLKS